MLLAQCQLYLINLSKNEKITTKIFGAALCLGIIVGAAATVDVHLSFDILSFVVPDAGIVFWVTKNGTRCGFISAHNFRWLCDKLGGHGAAE